MQENFMWILQFTWTHFYYCYRLIPCQVMVNIQDSYGSGNIFSNCATDYPINIIE